MFYHFHLWTHLLVGSKSLMDHGLLTSFPRSPAPPNFRPFGADESHSQHSDHKSPQNARFRSRKEEKHPGYRQVCYFFLVCSWAEEVLRERLPPSVSEVSEVQPTAHSWTACWGKKKKGVFQENDTLNPWIESWSRGLCHVKCAVIVSARWAALLLALLPEECLCTR